MPTPSHATELQAERVRLATEEEHLRETRRAHELEAAERSKAEAQRTKQEVRRSTRHGYRSYLLNAYNGCSYYAIATPTTNTLVALLEVGYTLLFPMARCRPSVSEWSVRGQASERRARPRSVA